MWSKSMIFLYHLSGFLKNWASLWEKKRYNIVSFEYCDEILRLIIKRVFCDAGWSKQNIFISFQTILISAIFSHFFTRYHYCADHDHTEYHCQKVSAKSVIRDRHGPVRVCLLHLRLRRTYRVWHTALFCQ